MSEPAEANFWSFIEMAKTTLAEQFGFEHLLATELLLSLNRASSLVTYDLEASVHRPRGRSWSAFRLLFVTWLVGPLEPGRAAELTGMSRAAVSNLSKTLIEDRLLTRTAGRTDGRSVVLALTEAGKSEMVTVFRDQNEREFEWASALTEPEQRILIMLLNKLITRRGDFDIRERF